ncbi:hypothetical protein PsYK624_065410 [Phanerochaete sordida]|uniref:Uncharacterized protein n=1 Tax=Phanerochaete sordida TaxID=48140 RepID=A0A9P3GAN5_9APHY|nr:hypothetical protein PsYK624_065410 [Phanerochaete sordida]
MRRTEPPLALARVFLYRRRSRRRRVGTIGRVGAGTSSYALRRLRVCSSRNSAIGGAVRIRRRRAVASLRQACGAWPPALRQRFRRGFSSADLRTILTRGRQPAIIAALVAHRQPRIQRRLPAYLACAARSRRLRCGDLAAAALASVGPVTTAERGTLPRCRRRARLGILGNAVRFADGAGLCVREVLVDDRRGRALSSGTAPASTGGFAEL